MRHEELDQPRSKLGNCGQVLEILCSPFVLPYKQRWELCTIPKPDQQACRGTECNLSNSTHNPELSGEHDLESRNIALTERC